MKKVVLTGIKPTGVPHIGNYFAVIKPAIEMQNSSEYDCFFFIADYHALNFIKDREELKRLTKEIACTWLACGLDPEKVIFYRQSDLPEVTELNWLLCNVTSKGLMNRAHAYKAMVDKAVEEGKDQDALVNMGLFNYPILMASDILLFNTKYVPVGQDQKQHVEMARDIAKVFNKTYGNTFVVPTEIIKESVATVPGIDGRKMSKSYDNTIRLFCTEEELKKRISQIKTDSSSPTDPKPLDHPIFTYYSLFANPKQIEEFAEKFKSGISWADAKASLFETANKYLKPYRKKYEYYIKHYDEVEQILKEGSKKAHKIAKETIKRARIAVGID